MDDDLPVQAGGSADLVRLAAAARGGDGLSRDRLLAMARPPMLRWAARLVDDPAVAEDVVQDALVEVCRTLAALREPAAVVGWLRLAVRKHAARHRHGRTPALLFDVDLVLPPSAVPGDGRGDPGGEVTRAEDRAVIRRALMLAADADRLLLVLRYYGGWPESDLAALLGISGGAVRKRLYDARHRLSAHVKTAPALPIDLVSPWEKLMTDVRAILGSSYNLDDPMPTLPPGKPPLSRPVTPERLPTGIKVLDILVPLPRGGVTDLTGPVGTGHLVLLAEILGNLAATGTAALVAVSSTERTPGVSARLWKLLDPPAPAASRTAVITAAPGQERQAVDLAGRLAAWLAHGDATVLLAVDGPTAQHTGPDLFAGRVGTCGSGLGSVTGLRLAPHPRDGSPVPPWPGADTEIRTGTAEMVAGQFPAVDVLASRSALLDGPALPQQDRTTARKARDLLSHTAEIQRYLTQPMHLAEPVTGIPGQSIQPEEAIAGLTRLLEETAGTEGT